MSDPLLPSCSTARLDLEDSSSDGFEKSNQPKCSSSSDSEDGYPSHILDWLRGGNGNNETSWLERPDDINFDIGQLFYPDHSPVLSRNNKGESCSRMKYDAEEILQRRKKDEEIHTKLEEVLRMDCGLNSSADRNSDNDDGDLKYFIKSEKELKIAQPTLTTAPNYKIINPKLSCAMFNHKTLHISNFAVLNISLRLPSVFDDNVDDLYTIMKLQTIVFTLKEKDDICTFFFFLMSVHPSTLIAETCYDFLMDNPSYYPQMIDVIIVFRNWGIKLEDMCKRNTDLYMGSHSGLKDKPSTRRQVNDHNFSLVFSYMNGVVKLGSRGAYVHLIEPLMRLVLDESIYNNCTWLCTVTSIIHSLIRTEDILLQDLHLKDLTLQNQTVLYAKILRHASCAVSLAYATIQQFLGKSNISYHKRVNVEKIYFYLTINNEEVLSSTSLDISCYLRLIDSVLFQKEVVDDEICDRKVNHQNWIDLLSDWSRCIAESKRSVDPVLLKEQISSIVYELKMKIACIIKQQNDLSVMGMSSRSEGNNQLHLLQK